MKNNLAIISLHLDALAQILDLPDGYTIQRTVCPSNESNMERRVKLVLNGPDLPEVKETEMIPELLCWRNDEKGEIGFTQGKIGTGIILQTKSAHDKKRMAIMEKLLSKIKVLMVDLPTCEDTCDLSVGPHIPECAAVFAINDSIEKLEVLTPKPQEKS